MKSVLRDEENQWLLHFIVVLINAKNKCQE